MCPSAEPSNQSGGVNISGAVGAVSGDIVGGNKGLDEERLVAVLEARGYLQPAKSAGIEQADDHWPSP